MTLRASLLVVALAAALGGAASVAALIPRFPSPAEKEAAIRVYQRNTGGTELPSSEGVDCATGRLEPVTVCSSAGIAVLQELNRDGDLRTPGTACERADQCPCGATRGSAACKGLMAMPPPSPSAP
jgi:hypothetical protein